MYMRSVFFIFVLFGLLLSTKLLYKWFSLSVCLPFLIFTQYLVYAAIKWKIALFDLQLIQLEFGRDSVSSSSGVRFIFKCLILHYAIRNWVFLLMNRISCQKSVKLLLILIQKSPSKSHRLLTAQHLCWRGQIQGAARDENFLYC